MSLELLNTFGTFVVIAATALAALVQLRHMRSSNQIAALSDLYERMRAPDFVSAQQFVVKRLPEKMQDPGFRYQAVHRAARTDETAELIAKISAVGSYHEEMGLLTKSRLIDVDLLCDMHSQTIIQAWDALSEFTAIAREQYGRAIYENFEYVTVLAQDWMAKHRAGTYPANVRRLDLPNKWRSTDMAYAASLAT
jgi:hypothetical protein